MTAVLAATFSPAAADTPRPDAATALVPAPNLQLAEIRPLEVRIRKLHVVRPDLLRFPMQYDIYC